MAYIKIVYQNSPSTATPLNAENLNHMDDQIALNDQRLTELEGAHVSSFNGRTGDVTAQSGDYNIGQIAPLTGAQVGQVPVVVNHGTEEDPELVFEMGAGGGGGHSIIDSEGNTMPQESAMQFADSFVSDDDVNGKTVVENVKELTLAELSQATERGMYLATDEESVPIGEIEKDVVSVKADGVKSVGTLLDELWDEIDSTKLSEASYLMYGDELVFNIVDITALNICFEVTRILSSSTSIIWSIMRDNGSMHFYERNLANGTFTDYTSTLIPSDGFKITLYYGTSSGIVELNTDARHCMMSDGVTSVEGLFKTVEYSIENDTSSHRYAYPTGFTIANCIFVNAKIFTKYDSFIDPSYGNGEYWGELSYKSDTFSYQARIAGNAKRIQFTFMKLVSQS